MRNTEADDDQNDRVASDIEDFFGIFDRLPFLGTLKKDIEELRALLYNRRAPRLLVVGARASGRSSLANALLRMPALPVGEATLSSREGWIRIDAHGRYLDWLEVESGPLEGGRKSAVRSALDETAPDVVLAVVSASGLDDEIEPLRTTLRAIHAMLEERRAAQPALIAAILQVDEFLRQSPGGAGRSRSVDSSGLDSSGSDSSGLDSSGSDSDGVGSGESSHVFAPNAVERVEALTDRMQRVLSEFGAAKRRRAFAVIAGGGDSPNLHWHLSQLATEIHAALPTVAKVESARALAVPHDVRRELAKSVVNRCSAAAVSIGLMPLPFADAFLLLPLQGVMVTSIAYLAGQPWDGRAGAEWLGSVGVMGGAAYALRFGAQQLAKVVPGWGSLISGGVAGGGTLAMGRSAIAYFVDGPGQREPRPLLAADTSASAD